MSLLFLHVGQSGNSIAQQLWPRLILNSYANAYPYPNENLPPFATSAASSSFPSSSSASFSLPSLALSSCSSRLLYSPFFTNKKAHAILIDTEPKVLRVTKEINVASVIQSFQSQDENSNSNKTSSRSKTSSSSSSTFLDTTASNSRIDNASQSSIFDEKALLWDQYGRGNNWSLGYAGRASTSSSSTGPSVSNIHNDTNVMVEEALETIRLQIEHLDACRCFLMLHSLAGGTGSGMGSRLMERVRDEYPHLFLYTVSVSPFAQGETPTQHYNTILALSSLLDSVDGILQFHNDTCLELLSSLLPNVAAESLASSSSALASSTSAASVPFVVLNSLIADSICNVIQEAPFASGEITSSSSSQSRHSLASLASLISSCQPTPHLKLLEVDTTSGVYEASDHDSLPWTACADSLVHVVRSSTATAYRKDNDRKRQLEKGSLSSADHRRSDSGNNGSSGRNRGSRRNSGKFSSSASTTPSTSITLSPVEYAVIARGARAHPMTDSDILRVEEKLGRVLSSASLASTPSSPSSSSSPRSSLSSSSAASFASKINFSVAPRLGQARHHGLIGERWCIDNDSLSPLSYSPYSLTLLSNDTRCLPRLSCNLFEAQRQWSRGFYKHWYERYGCDTEYFQQACHNVQDLMSNYQAFENKT